MRGKKKKTYEKFSPGFLTGAVAAGGKPTILGADPAACSVLLAGAEGDVAGSILKLLNARGIARDNILTSDFF